MAAVNTVDLTALKILILVIGGKGGIGKSLLSQIIAARLRAMFQQVFTVDTDHTNNTTRSIDPGAKMIDLWDVKARGGLSLVFDAMKKASNCAAVIDTAAQEDKLIDDVMDWMAERATAAGVTIIPVLPIVLSVHNQRKAIDFSITAERLSLPLVYVTNHGQGRKKEDFDRRWSKTRSRAEALARGATETVLLDAGARYADEAGGFGLSLADAALGRFEKAGDKAEEAAASFDENDRAWLNIALSETGAKVLAAASESIAKRRELDAAKRR